MAASGVAAAVLLLLLLVGGPGQAASAPVCEDGKQTEYRARIMLSLMPGGDTDYSYLLTELIPNATALSPADVEVSSYESVTVNTNDVGKQRLYANNGGNKNRLRALGFRFVSTLLVCAVVLSLKAEPTMAGNETVGEAPGAAS